MFSRRGRLTCHIFEQYHLADIRIPIHIFFPAAVPAFAAALLAQQAVDVVVPQDAPPLERFAAAELASYLDRLFPVKTRITDAVSASSKAVFLVGRSEAGAAGRELGDQAILLRTTRAGSRPALTIAGGSPRATLWAVYELVERWGVVYLTDGDVLPSRRSAFRMPQLDVAMEPRFRIRAHPTIQDFAPSGEAWGIEGFRTLIDQLAKLKFNRMNVYPFGWQPFLDYQVNGIRRRSAWLWYDYHYPVTPNMPGRAIFGSAAEFWNPDLPLNGSYDSFIRAGEQLMRGILDHAHSRGMECVITANLTEYPPEFEPLLKSARKVHQVGTLTVVPGPETPLDDPGLLLLAKTV